MLLRISSLALFGLLLLQGCSEEAPKPAPKPRSTEPKLRPKVSPKKKSILETAKRIQDAAITIDTHVDIPGTHYGPPEMDPGVDNPDLRCDLVKMKNGGVDAVFLAAFTSQRPDYSKEKYAEIYESTVEQIKAIHRVFERYPDRAEQAKVADDVVRIEKSGKRSIVVGVENGYPVGDDLGNVKRFHDLGARYITLVHGRHNQICDSSKPEESEHNGLSEFGKKLVAEMNKVGVMVDLSHASVKSFFDVLELTKAPVIASHSGCHALNPHHRNLTDDQLRALAKNGGTIQIVALGAFLKQVTPEYEKKTKALRAEMGIPGWWEYDRMSKAEREKLSDKMNRFRARREEIMKSMSFANVSDYVDHIDHAVKIAGIDHVGIGTDFDGGAGIPGFRNHAEALNVTVELVKRGYSEEDIKKIWGENLLRVWREAEGVAKESP